MKLFRSVSVNSLLSNIKSTVELLVQFRGDSLTTKYGAIDRLRLAIVAILSHGLKQVCRILAQFHLLPHKHQSFDSNNNFLIDQLIEIIEVAK